jgi:predicted SprT family Zn-dependent metalloprotease
MVINEDGDELSTEQVMKELLQHHSLHYVLYLAMKTYGYDGAEYIADKVMKTIDEVM